MEMNNMPTKLVDRNIDSIRKMAAVITFVVSVGSADYFKKGPAMNV
jgi:hypothetical protein